MLEVTCPAAEYHRRLFSTELYCLVTEAREQHAQSHYIKVKRLRLEPATSRSLRRIPAMLRLRKALN